MPLTYVRMVLRQHATPELQHPFLHRKRIRIPSKGYVRRSKIAHGHNCTSYSKANHLRIDQKQLDAAHETIRGEVSDAHYGALSGLEGDFEQLRKAERWH